MTIKLSSLKSNLKLEDDGEWKDVPEWPGVSLLVRSINCEDYRIARDLLHQRLTEKLGRLPISVEMDHELPRLFADFLLRGWKGLDIEYTPEIGAQYLTDPEFRELAEKVGRAAARVGKQEIEFVEVAAKN